MQHADGGGYSRCGNFGGSLVLTMVSMYLPDGNNVYDSEMGSSREFTCSDTFAVGCIIKPQ